MVSAILTQPSQWDKVSEGAASSYFGTCLSGFPNFFMMMGPNTLSGHLSVIYTTECQINFTLRVIKPILRALSASRSVLPSIGSVDDIVEVKSDAEKRDIDTVQEKARKLVWATGCTSWFIETKSKRNTIMFPDWQYRFWLRSIFIPWNDFDYRKSKDALDTKGGFSWSTLAIFMMSIFVGTGTVLNGCPEWASEILAKARSLVWL